MNDKSQETLHKVESNDNTVIKLSIGHMDGGFDFNRLGRAIATNTNITLLNVSLHVNALSINDTGFYDGLKQNTSIHELMINCNGHNHTLSGVGHEILQAYQENNNHLTNISIFRADLHNSGDEIITTTLQCCTNLRYINLFQCNITANQLLPMVEAMRGLRSLEQLYLNNNNIGNDGCEALATLLEDPNSNLEQLQINRNNIGNEGAILIANSLVKNKKLQRLDLSRNLDVDSVWDQLSYILCNTSSINDTYSSNHTLQMLRVTNLDNPSAQRLRSLLKLNTDANKRHVAIKILTYHLDIDMKPLFGWDIEGEWTLKALPYVINWFERVWIAKVSEFDERQSAFVHELERDRFNRRTLSSIYKFAKAMPLRFVPADHVKMHDKKRKRAN